VAAADRDPFELVVHAQGVVGGSFEPQGGDPVGFADDRDFAVSAGVLVAFGRRRRVACMARNVAAWPSWCGVSWRTARRSTGAHVDGELAGHEGLVGRGQVLGGAQHERRCHSQTSPSASSRNNAG
jgi:hypothetical protein